MNKKFAKIVSCFILNKEKRHNFRKKHCKKKIYYKLENINKFKENLINIYNKRINNVNLNIKNLENDDVLNELLKIDNFYFLPNIGNFGDILIANSEYKFFESNNLKYNVFTFNQNIDKEINFVYGGGGIFTPYYNYQFVLDIFKNEKIKKIVILPASFYKLEENNLCENMLNIIDERFVIFCREEQSYNYLKSKNLKAKIILSNDMAFSLKDNCFKDVNLNQDKLDNCKKLIDNLTEEDISNIYKNIYLEYIKAYIKTTSMFKYLDKKDKKIGYLLREDIESKTNWNDYNIQSLNDLSCCCCGNSQDYPIVNIVSKIFLSAIDYFDIIITDRLHVAIGAMLLNKEVFIIDNSYGKLSNVYQKSMKDFKNIHLINDINTLKDKIKEVEKNCKITSNTNILNNIFTFEEFMIEYLLFSNNLEKSYQQTIY